MLEFWGDLGFIVFAASSALFTFAYLTLSQWYKSLVGTLIAIFMICVVIVTTYFTLRIWGIAVPGVEWVRLVIFWLLGSSMLTSTIAFLEVQFGRRARNLRKHLAKRYVDVKDVESTPKEME